MTEKKYAQMLDEAMQRQLIAVMKVLAEFKAEVREEFAGVHGKIEEMNRKFDSTHENLERVNVKLKDANGKFAEVHKRFAETKSGIADIRYVQAQHTRLLTAFANTMSLQSDIITELSQLVGVSGRKGD